LGVVQQNKLFVNENGIFFTIGCHTVGVKKKTIACLGDIFWKI